MKKIEINNYNEFSDSIKELNNESDNQVIFSLLGKVERFYPIKFLKQKLIMITNEQEEEIVIEFELEPRPLSNDPHWEFNRTGFSFGEMTNSIIVFSNLTFSHYISEHIDIVTIEKLVSNYGKYETIDLIESTDFNLKGCNEMLFMETSHKSNLTFFNCKFKNTTNKNFKILTRDDSIVKLINCEFIGDFMFEQLGNSKIVKK